MFDKIKMPKIKMPKMPDVKGKATGLTKSMANKTKQATKSVSDKIKGLNPFKK